MTVLNDQGFAGFDPVKTKFAPPIACPGTWSKVVLDVDTHVRGVQYDRIGMLWLGRHELLRFSTAEPTRSGIHYHVEKDVTVYAPLMRTPQQVTTLLGNLVNKEYTGVIYLTATLTFYEAERGAQAAAPAEDLVAIDGPKRDTLLADGTLTKTLTGLPRNITGARLALYATNHGCDEFWYSNQPDQFAAAHKKDGLCGGNAYREIDIRIDGKIANVVFPFPYIWTGGVNPLLWRPLSAIHTLDVPPYEIDLDPFAGVLADGKTHTLAISVLDDRGSWPMDGTLFLTTDPRASRTGGAAMTTAAAQPVLEAHAATAGGGTRFWLSANRSLKVRGYVDTSSGRVWHAVATTMSFANLQFLDLATGEGDATQSTTFTTTTTRSDPTKTTTKTTYTSYPLVVNATYPLPAQMKPYTLVIEAEVHQGLHVRSANGECDATADATATLKRIVPHVDAIAVGKTSETNACSGSDGSFSIRKSATNGALNP